MHKLATHLAQAGARWDEQTGAISMPVYHSSTFRHPALGQSTGFDYSRTANPTGSVLEQTLALAEGGPGAPARLPFPQDIAAIDAIMHLFEPGDRIWQRKIFTAGHSDFLKKFFVFMVLTLCM